ncbi:MAG: hypothetical protein ACK5P0_01450 [bacterium]
MMNNMNYDLIEKFEYLISKMKNEGFHYCFKHYSSFEEIDDDKFHLLRENYLKSADELKDDIETRLEN